MTRSSQNVAGLLAVGVKSANRLWLSLAVAAALTGMATSGARAATAYYWDTNGTATGSGSATGTWSSGSDAVFTTNSAGTAATTTATTTAADTLTFSAGTNGTAGTVTLSGDQAVGAVIVNQAGLTLQGSKLSTNRLVVNGNNTLTLKTGGTLTEVDGSTNGGTIDFAGGTYSMGNGAWDAISNGSLNMKFTNDATFNATGPSLGYLGAVNVTYSSSGTSTLTGATIGRAANSSLTIQSGTINGGTSTIAINGGRVEAPSAALIVSGTGTFTAGTLALNPASGGSATLTVSGGTLNTNSITTAATGTKSITLSGGVLGVNSTTTGVTWAPDMTLGGNTTLRAATLDGTAANITLSGVLSGAGGFTKTGGGTLTVSNAANSYTGSTTVSAGTLSLTNGSQLQFVLGANGVNNSITVSNGATLSLGGNFAIDTSAAVTNIGNAWTLVSNAGTANYLPTFALLGFTKGADNVSWTKAIAADRQYQFANSTGVLSVVAVPEPASIGGLIMLAGAGLIRRRKA